MAGVTAVRETRTSREVEIQRKAAEELLNPNRYEVEYRRGVLDAFDWVEGLRTCSPVTGDVLPEPNAWAIDAEMTRAEEVERMALERGLGAQYSVYPGAVGLALSWYLKDAFTEAPY